MKKLITLVLAALLLTVMASCRCTTENSDFDGTWVLIRIGEDTFPGDDVMEIKQCRTYEDNIENGRIVKEGEQYYLVEKNSGNKYPCELKSGTLIFHTPKDDPDFEGKDIIYRKQ